MKKDILKLLLDHEHCYLSGEEISGILGVSRTAIWKQINNLREEGYIIESAHSQGYRLTGKPDAITAEELLIHLDKGFINELHVFEEISSTNDFAKKRAGEGAPEATLVVAEKQSDGRGRMSRHWISPAGSGIWLSLVLRPKMMPAQAAQLTFVSAVAVCLAIREFTGLKATIKWPNDVMLDGKKICGILTELSAEIDGINYVVAGIGVNVNQLNEDFPSDLRAKATSLRIASGQAYRRVELLAYILKTYHRVYRDYRQKGFAYIIEKWRELNSTLGFTVNVISQQEEYYGQAVDIDEEGQLVVMTPEKELRYVMVGDVSIRNKE